jgi:DNA-binding NarL/FixJ family response regulator
MSDTRTRVVIADDHAIVREGIRALLTAAPDVKVEGEARTGREAIDLAVSLQPDIILMDIAMPDLGGLEATIEIRRLAPSVRVVVLSQYGDREYVQRFLKAGVSGYILKSSAGADLLAAIRAVVRGGLALDPTVARDALQNGSEGEATADLYDALTDREKQVLKLVAEGHSNKDVAALLNISVKTAMSHREHLMEKLRLHNRTELVRYALKRGVIRVDL